MTMKFSPSVRNLMLGRGILAGLTTTVGVTVYSGTQPPSATVASSWATYNSSAANYLVHYAGVGWTQPNDGLMLQISTFPALTNAVRSGTASWAIIWSTEISQASLDGTTLPHTSFMVVPVSTAVGTGVIRFDSVDFISGTAIRLRDGSIAALTS